MKQKKKLEIPYQNGEGFINLINFNKKTFLCKKNYMNNLTDTIFVFNFN